MDLKIYNPKTKDIIIPFQKKSAADYLPPPVKLTFYNKKNEEIEFNNYFQYLQKFGFVWEHLPINVGYSIELSTDKLKLIKK